MKGFRFRLQRVLDVRRHRLEEARRTLARARQRLDVLATELRALEAQSRRAAEEMRAELARGLAAGKLAARQEGIYCLREDAEQRTRETEAARAELDAARLRVIEAQRGVRTLERLRERALAAYRVGCERLERRELDEAGSLAWGRREGTG